MYFARKPTLLSAFKVCYNIYILLLIGDTMKLEYEVLHPFYKTLYDLVGQENMLKIYDEYRGMQISVPMKLYDRNLAAEKIRKEYDGTNLAELTKRYGYSQRWGSNLIKDK